MHRPGRIIWGAVFLFIGIGFAGDVLDLWEFTLFFRGWWTLFIIVPCIISIINSEIRAGNVISLIIGVALLLAAQDIVSWGTIGRLILPAILIWIGLAILFKGRPGKAARKSAGEKGLPTYTAVFGEYEASCINERFSGANLTAVFGKVNLNIRHAVIEQDVEINIVAIFGGADIYIPSNVNVKVSCVLILGGVSNSAAASAAPDSPTVYINSTCVLGGVEIK